MITDRFFVLSTGCAAQKSSSSKAAKIMFIRAVSGARIINAHPPSHRLCRPAEDRVLPFSDENKTNIYLAN